MNDASILILALATQQLLFATGWWLSARYLAGARVAMLHWAGFCLASGGSLLLFTELAREALGGAAMMLRNTGVVLAFVLLRRGLLAFTRQPLRDREQWALFAAFVAVMAVVGLAPAQAVERTVVISAMMSWLMARAAIEVIRGGSAEFGGVAVAVIGSPLLLLGGVMALRAVLALTNPDTGAVSITQAAHFNIVLLLTMVVISSMLHVALGFLVMRRMVLELQHLSSHDSLTRLLNRRAFESRLAQEVAASRRTGAPLGLLMVDIDHFKHINDRFGHHVGDTALRQTAQRLAQAARLNDVVARVGGEEFGVLLPATDAAGIRQSAERLRHAVGHEPLAFADGLHPVTVSVGASMLLTQEADPEVVLRRADQALYRAKAEGRDRVVFDTLAQVSDGDAATPLRAASRPAELR